MLLNLERFKDNLAVITDRGERLTYSELNLESKKFTVAVPQKGLLFCLCENRLGSLVGYVSCLEHHIPIVLLDGSKDNSVLKNLIELYRPEYIWASTEKSGEIGGRTIYTYASFSLQQMYYDTAGDHSEINPELALCLTTSGSTGSPKFVRLSEKNVLSNAKSIAEYLQIDENERPITMLPSYYSYGVSVINSHLIKGASILLTEGTIAQRDFWNFMKEHRATSISGVPYTFEMLKRLRFFRMELPDLKVMTQAGGKLNKDIAKEYIDFAFEKGKKFFVMYGQTEATARMSYLPWESALDKYASIGIAIPGGEFSLINNEGKEIIEPDIDGELVYKGPNVSLGYAECRKDLTKGDENNGVLHTGDVARRDADGFYYITGRIKRFIKIYGNRVNLDASEQIVKAITPDCVCVGKDDKMIVYVTDESVCSSVRTLLSEKTGLNNRAFEVRSISEIPKNGSGKVQYAELNNE
jgi:acyl-coenzyme A synthetase/AMP-(fatty) acid ligase